MEILKGKIKYTAGKVFEGQFGPSINAAVTLANGNDIRVYGKPDDEKLKSLKKDDEVTIIYDGKSYKVAFDMTTADNVAAPGEAPQPKPNGKLTHDELWDKLNLMTTMYAEIFNKLQAEGLEAEQAQPGASTIFIQLGKYF